jgi:hypothetical protein
MLQAGRSRVQFPMRSLGFTIGVTQPLTEMSTRNILEVKDFPARKADNLTTIC